MYGCYFWLFNHYNGYILFDYNLTVIRRCSNTRLEAIVSEILSALLKRLTDLERHEEELRSCQTSNNVIATITTTAAASAATSTEKVN